MAAAAGGGVSIVQPGEGLIRPLLVTYALDVAMPQLQAALGPKVAILRQGVSSPPGKHAVFDFPAIMPLDELILTHLGKLGAVALSPVVLGAFSAGGSGPRSQLREGFTPDGICILDGNHATDPPFVAQQIEPWRRFFSLARSKKVSCICTHTAIKTGPGILSTTATLEEITGVPMPPPSPSEGIAIDVSDGFLRVYGYGGTDKAAHAYQVTHVAAPMVRQTFRFLNPALCAGPGCELPFSPPPPPPPGKGAAGEPPALELAEAKPPGWSPSVKLAVATMLLGGAGYAAAELAGW